jgi:tetratricopeptide (TPR) repeat protein
MRRLLALALLAAGCSDAQLRPGPELRGRLVAARGSPHCGGLGVGADYPVLRQHATELQRNGRLEEALACRELLVAAHPSVPFGWAGLGSLLGKLEPGSVAGTPAALLARQAHEVAAALFEAAGDAVNAAKSHNNAGSRLLESEGNPSAAAEIFERALRAQPDYLVARTNLALARRQQTRWQEAEAAATAAVRLASIQAERGGPDDAAELGAALLILGEVREDAGNRDAALPAYRQASLVAPENLATWCRLALAQRQLCDWQDWRAVQGVFESVVRRHGAARAKRCISPFLQSVFAVAWGPEQYQQQVRSEVAHSAQLGSTGSDATGKGFDSASTTTTSSKNSHRLDLNQGGGGREVLASTYRKDHPTVREAGQPLRVVSNACLSQQPAT